MSILRSGLYGDYYGSTFSESSALSEAQMKLNAEYIKGFFSMQGWSINAIAAILGNIEAESSMNPGRWQSDNVNNTSGGYGLVQWTPATKYFNYCDEFGLEDPSEMDNNIFRIQYEVDREIQWISTSDYPSSFKEFSISTNSVNYLARAFLINYERPADQSETVQAYRSSLASKWYTYLTGEDPGESGEDPGSSDSQRIAKKHKFNFLLFNSRKKAYRWTKRLF